MPAQYIYEPWMAPPSVQKTAKCIIGEDYPMCIVDHNVIHKKNIERMKQAYEMSKNNAAEDDDDDTKDKVEKTKPTTSATKKNERPKSSGSQNSAKIASSSIKDFFQAKTSPDSQPPNKKAKK